MNVHNHDHSLESPYTPGFKKEETSDYLSPIPQFPRPERQNTRTSVVASLGGGLPPDPEEPDPPKESLRGCVVLLGCVLIAGKPAVLISIMSSCRAHGPDDGCDRDITHSDQHGVSPSPTHAVGSQIVWLIGTMLHYIHRFGMSVGALQTYYHSEVYTSTPESVIALIGGLIAFVSRSNPQGGCLVYVDIDADIR
jgi:hypothetical protein